MDAILLKAGSFILIITAGYLLKKIGLIQEQDNKTIMKLIVNLTLPAAVISSFAAQDRELSLIFVAVIGFGLNVVMAAVGYLFALHKGGQEKAFNILNYSGYNIGTFAMPYLQSFLGSMGVIVACLFDAGNAMMCTGISYVVASGCVGKKEKFNFLGLLKKLFSSIPFTVYIIMMVLYFLGIHLPGAVYSMAGTFGSANAFLAMFMIGNAFEFCHGKDELKSVTVNLIVRFLLAALFAVLIYQFLPLSLLVRRTLAIIVFAPITSMAVIHTVKCGGDGKRAGIINSMSILISLVIMTSLISYWKIGV